MLVANGVLDADHTPHLQFEIAGEPFEQYGPTAKLTAVIDTGFVGFVSLPLKQAFPLSLPLSGVISVKLADGRRSNLLTAKTHVRIGDRSERVTVILQPKSTEVLVGVALLRALNLALLLTRDKVLLLDQDSIDDIYSTRPGHLVVRDSAADAFGERAA